MMLPLSCSKCGRRMLRGRASGLCYKHRPRPPSQKRMCRECGRDGTERSMWFLSGGVYGLCVNVQACEKRRIAGDRKSDREEARRARS